MRRAALGMLSLLLFVSSCSLGPKEDWADAIHDAPEKATRASTARVRVAVVVKVIETNIRQTVKPLIADLEGVVDFRQRQARLAGLRADKPSVRFNDLVVYLPRSKASKGTSRQHWARFDFEREPKVDIDDTDRRLAVGAAIISPALVPELLEGVLTGSVERRGTERRVGTSTTRYSAKLSPDAAAREISDEDRREGVQRIFQTLGVQQDVFPVDIWLDQQGRARRIRFVMRQQKDRVNAFELRIAWELYNYGVLDDITIPRRADTVEARRFREFVVQFIREQI